MEALISLAMLVGGIFLFVKVVGYFRHQGTWNRAYVQVGQRYNGKKPNGGVTYGMLFSRPTLAFPYRETFCQLKSRRSSYFEVGQETTLRIQLSIPLPDMEVTTGPLQRRGFYRDHGVQVEIDDPEFQSVFNVAAKKNDAAFVQRRLQPGVRWQLEQLRRQGADQQVHMQIRRGSMTVTKPGFIVSHQQLDDFVRFSLQLYDQLLLAGAQGIDFVEATATVVDDVKCPICSEEILYDMVVCTRCKTPHCRDCWQYNGQCATFACGETRFLQVGPVSDEA